MQKISVPLLIFITVVTGGIYLPVWYLRRRPQLNRLQSREKLGAGAPLFGVLCFSISVGLSLWSIVVGGLDQAVEPAMNPFELTANLLVLIGVVPLVHQTFKIKRILADHFNGHLKQNIEFSNALTLLFLNFYLQSKINRLHDSGI